jgi:hypothetical protein
MSTPTRIRTSTLLTLAATLAPPLVAHAGYMVGTSAGTYVGFSRGCDATYNSVYGNGSVFMINGSTTPCPASPWTRMDGNTPVEVVYDGVVDPGGSRTAAWDRSFQGINNRDSVATARAASDLATASLHAFAQGGGNNPGGGGSRAATVSATLRDTLHFNVAGAGATTVTSITVRMSLDGHTAASLGANFMSLDWRMNFGGASVFDLADNQNVAGEYGARSQTAQGWSSFFRTVNVISPDNTDIQIEAIYDLVGASADIDVGGSLMLQVDNATLDYENTGKFSLVLPAGVTYTSDSGVFLAPAAVPEPTSWALTAVGLLALGLRSSRRPRRR